MFGVFDIIYYIFDIYIAYYFSVLRPFVRLSVTVWFNLLLGLCCLRGAIIFSGGGSQHASAFGVAIWTFNMLNHTQLLFLHLEKQSALWIP